MYEYMIYQPKQVWKFFLTAIRFQWKITNLPPKQLLPWQDDVPLPWFCGKIFHNPGNSAKNSWQIPMITQIDPQNDSRKPGLWRQPNSSKFQVVSTYEIIIDALIPPGSLASKPTFGHEGLKPCGVRRHMLLALRKTCQTRNSRIFTLPLFQGSIFRGHVSLREGSKMVGVFGSLRFFTCLVQTRNRNLFASGRAARKGSRLFDCSLPKNMIASQVSIHNFFTNKHKENTSVSEVYKILI